MIIDIKEKLERMRQNSIVLKIDETEQYKPCGTRFGGRPDVPPHFVWPTFRGENYDGTVKDRPLAFLAQFNCEDLAPYDTEHLLPDHGLLSFFYEMDTQRWGFDPGDRGCARVFWFEDTSTLTVADYPAEMEEDFKFPLMRIKLTAQTSLPGCEDFIEACGDVDFEAYRAAREELGVEEPNECSKLLGWADTIQGSMPVECDLVNQGFYLGRGWGKIPRDIQQQAKETALDRWTLLFQLDMVTNGDFELMFGDCGRIYFYILKEDLLARRFDWVWLILQCC